ncbi:orotidine-5'-phosphate decarboxylase [Dellaglioa algida]|uniref:Orotidine 5'-phosphate decarboxylase n=1 Tax=Dellaglioa algida TaxID=105612 RepID=A0A2C8EKW7_9LACO|nr:orotidine-5'-phosphate decarboxylase [Dellaglioa algida]MDK1716549.1 orotidine-5'-phosphate decarboxylase [Dellaglioa algida]MDK1718028.1 orotidine-5'-phosphate decarboxylase [Dellaglioa algida]MDK1719958.1 orotidine-5'-phosphate decarboxylase [Dellaglioa algida]MDK1721491.1 orotidine-5'-phosphate decarboxylase [Dellaglioa algida]MDK1723287.1 orotidine-5'-phosphate decarboxylase [Dellaglioa algida]
MINRPIIALDFQNKHQTTNFLQLFPQDEQLFVKVGMELFYSEGTYFVEELIDQGHDIFLDLKCHDIPNTVRQTMTSLSRLGISLTTVHAAGGVEMMKYALDGINKGNHSKKTPQIIAITQLTSTSQEQLETEQLVERPLIESVVNYAKLTELAGLSGVVCSAQEAKIIKEATSKDFLAVTPGIRLEGQSVGDQKRVMTPIAAKKNQSSAIVVGRSITQAENPFAAYQTIKKMWEDA